MDTKTTMMPPVSGRRWRRGTALLAATLTALAACTPAASAQTQSAARQWNEQLLDAIRIDTPRPTVHARNLFHTSGAMYDAWSAYDSGSAGYLFSESQTGTGADRDEAVSYAAYRVLSARFAASPGAATTIPALNAQMASMGYDISNTSTLGNTAAAVGNRAAAAYLNYGLTDGSNEQLNYADYTGYAPSNPPLDVAAGGDVTMADPDRWQPLIVQTPSGPQTQSFLTPHWGDVSTFAITRPGLGGPYGSDLAGPPPAFGSDDFKDAANGVIRYSSHLDPGDGATLNISPNTRGNNTLGSNDGSGWGVNPATGMPYADNIVNRGDYGRVLAEFWADGPRSETPPGHWNTIANEVSDHPLLQKRIGGTGNLVDDLEWDVKMYFALNAGAHDAAVSSWDAKRQVDYVRPISMIRYMATLGQSSDPAQPSYHPDGMKLEDGLVEVVTADTIASGRHAGLEEGDIAIFAWNGHDDSGDPSGVGWIDGREWMPYQAESFVTPAFAGYVSGHSTFSRSAAEILTLMTGDEFFPGGMGTFLFEEGAGLNFEDGPSQDIALQWATYFDAADEAGLSRLYGGIHVRADDFDGRIIGNYVGNTVWDQSLLYFNNTVPEPATALAAIGALGLLLQRRRA